MTQPGNPKTTIPFIYVVADNARNLFASFSALKHNCFCSIVRYTTPLSWRCVMRNVLALLPREECFANCR